MCFACASYPADYLLLSEPMRVCRDRLLILLVLYSRHWHCIWRYVIMLEDPEFSSTQQVDKGHVGGRYFLAKHPQAMAKLEAELDAAGLLVTAQRPRPRAITFADISKLRYLDCVVKVACKSAPVLLGGTGDLSHRFVAEWSICGKLYMRCRAEVFSLWPWQSTGPHVRAASSLSCALQW